MNIDFNIQAKGLPALLVTLGFIATIIGMKGLGCALILFAFVKEIFTSMN